MADPPVPLAAQIEAGAVDDRVIAIDASSSGSGSTEAVASKPVEVAPSLPPASTQRADMLHHKLLYVLSFGSYALYAPFLSLYLEKVCGLSKAHVGVVMCMQPFVTLVSGPLVGAYSDRGGVPARRRVLLWSLVLGTLLRACTYFVRSYSLLVLWVLAVEAIATAFIPALDAAVYAELSKRGQSERYGHIRAFGGVGWGVFALLGGAVWDTAGVGALFLTSVAIGLPAFWLVSRIAVEERTLERGASSLAVWKAAINVDVCVFAGVVLTLGWLTAVIQSYLFLWLGSLGASQTLLGLSVAVTCASEVPVFLYADRLLRRFGVKAMLCGALATLGVRMFMYAALSNPWAVLPIELLHGLCYALGWTAATKFADDLLPRELATSAQNILGTLQWGVGAGAGSLIGGAIYQSQGGPALFRTSGVVAFVVLVLQGASMVHHERARKGKAAAAATGAVAEAPVAGEAAAAPPA